LQSHGILRLHAHNDNRMDIAFTHMAVSHTQRAMPDHANGANGKRWLTAKPSHLRDVHHGIA